ncbi:MAG: NPCBM/NEW2 domain-containing protein [Pirellulaceae bacterium]|nr:NPCBM/NEW2 domain-containing protein [Pirellulaceae bacterium]
MPSLFVETNALAYRICFRSVFFVGFLFVSSVDGANDGLANSRCSDTFSVCSDLAASRALQRGSTDKVNIKLLSGQEYEATLVEVTEKEIYVQTEEGLKQLNLDNLLSMTFSGSSAPPPSPLVWVLLTDGSFLECRKYQVDDRIAKVELVTGEKVEIRTKHIHSVRFKKEQKELQPQWDLIINEEEVSSDLLIVRRNTPPKFNEEGELIQEGTIALDYLEGSIGKITEEGVEFLLDGEEIPLVNREKVEGLRYVHTTQKNYDKAVATIESEGKSRWKIRSWTYSEGSYLFTLLCGVDIKTTKDSLSQIDFSADKVAFLSDLEPTTFTWKPYFSFGKRSENYARLFTYRKDQSLGGEELRLGNQIYEKGLALRSKTTIEYWVGRKYRKLLATVGIDEATNGAGDLYFTLLADDEILFERAVTGKDEPFEINLDIEKKRRLTIIVDYGKGRDVLDHLILGNIRVIK